MRPGAWRQLIGGVVLIDSGAILGDLGAVAPGGATAIGEVLGVPSKRLALRCGGARVLKTKADVLIINCRFNRGRLVECGELRFFNTKN